MKQKIKIKERPFKGWEIDESYATSPDKKYKITYWLGFLCFDDARPNSMPLLALLSFWQRRKLWKKLKQELIIRASGMIYDL